MEYVISYASNGYYESQLRFKHSILDRKVKVLLFKDIWLKKQLFYLENKSILDQQRGAGYWLWKPYILLETFAKMQDGDRVIYCDADAVVQKTLSCLFDICDQNGGIMLFDNSTHQNKSWIKRDCFVLMEADEPLFYTSGQAMGGFLVLKKNEHSQKFLEEWLNYAKDYRISTDSENELGMPNLPDFIEHRHDQAILSIMRIKWNLPLFRDPSQYGNPYKMIDYRKSGEFLIDNIYQEDSIKTNSPYDTLIDLRDPVPEVITLFKRIKIKFKQLKNL